MFCWHKWNRSSEVIQRSEVDGLYLFVVEDSKVCAKCGKTKVKKNYYTSKKTD